MFQQRLNLSTNEKHNCIPVIIDKCGQYTAYCTYCHETMISNNEGKSWSLLKEIQSEHPNTKAAFEIALRNDLKGNLK